MYKKDLNNGNYLKSRLSKAGIWNEIVTLARINDWKFSRVKFLDFREPSVEELLSDEFMLFHQSKSESSSISSLCHHGMADFFAGDNLSQSDMVQHDTGGVLTLSENEEPAYLLLENCSNEKINSLSVKSVGRPFYHLDEFLEYLTAGITDCHSSSVLDKALVVQENFRKLSCHGARLFHQVKDPLATNILAYANY